MTRGLADTSVFIARESGRPLDEGALPDEIAVSVVTIGELRAGVLVAPDVRTRDRRLTTLTEALALDPLPVDAAVAEAWARLRVLLCDAGLRMPVGRPCGKGTGTRSRPDGPESGPLVNLVLAPRGSQVPDPSLRHSHLRFSRNLRFMSLETSF